MVNEVKSIEDRKESLIKLGKEKGYVTYDNTKIYEFFSMVAMVFLVVSVVLAIFAEVQVLLKKKKGTFLVILAAILILVGTFLSEAIAILLTK